MKTWILFFLLIFSINPFSYSQCPQFYDFDGNLSSTPEWIACDGNDFILSLQSNEDIGNYSIDWGDGSPQSSGTSWLANTPIEHTYSQTVATYTVTINLDDIPCTVIGEITMEEPTNASIQIPFGGLTSTCAPGSLEFINSSTDVSENTSFIWNFFDGTATETYDHTNVGQLISHLYEKGSVNCATQVTLTAENKCNTLQGGPSLATFTPLRIWDIDKASISANKTLLCYPDVSVSFQNTTERNCYAQGNVSQRYEYWNLGDYWGLGYDSIINWRPWPPTLDVNVDYPNVGVYEVMLIDSSYCGLDTATISINTANASETANTQYTNTGSETQTFNTQLISSSEYGCTDTSYKKIYVYPQPTVDFTASPVSQMLPNSTVEITNNSSPGNWFYIWDFGDNNQSDLENPSPHTYSTFGNYPIKLVMSNEFSCSDSVTVWIEILSNTPIADFNIDERGCAPLLVNFTNNSQNATSFNWDFGDGTYSNIENPNKIYHQDGVYSVSLTVFNESGSHSITKANSVEVFKNPISQFSVNSDYIQEQGVKLITTNQSQFADNYKWDFGDSYTSIENSPTHYYENNGIYTVILIAYNDACSDTSMKNITIANGEGGYIIIPNAFTPSNNYKNDGNFKTDDEVNDIFYPVISGAKSYSLDIYNRWGEHLFHTDNLLKGWNGYFKGELCQQDVYIYNIHVVYHNNTEEKLVGHLTLVR